MKTMTIITNCIRIVLTGALIYGVYLEAGICTSTSLTLIALYTEFKK